MARFFTDIGQTSGGLIFEVRVKAESFWQTKFRFLLDDAKTEALKGWLSSTQCVVRQKNLVHDIAMPCGGGEAWSRCVEGITNKRGMSFDPTMTEMMSLPCLNREPQCFAFRAIPNPQNSAVLLTIDILGCPMRTAYAPVIELLCAEMDHMSREEQFQMPDSPSRQSTAYQTFIARTKIERGMEPFDLPAILFSSLVQKFKST